LEDVKPLEMKYLPGLPASDMGHSRQLDGLPPTSAQAQSTVTD
jgi:hypothetical protein